MAAGLTTYAALAAQLSDVTARTRAAFDIAAAEPKLTSREEQIARVAQPLASMPTPPVSSEENGATGAVVLSPPDLAKESNASLQVMRKHMNGVIDELLQTHRNAVYLSEDGCHGGCVHGGGRGG